MTITTANCKDLYKANLNNLEKSAKAWTKEEIEDLRRDFFGFKDRLQNGEPIELIALDYNSLIIVLKYLAR